MCKNKMLRLPVGENSSTVHFRYFEMFLIVLYNLEWFPLPLFRYGCVVLVWSLIVKELVNLLSLRLGYWHENLSILHDSVV